MSSDPFGKLALATTVDHERATGRVIETLRM